MREVRISAASLDRLGGLLPPDRADRLHEYATRSRSLLAGRTVWNISSTAQGGGVAEMLRGMVAYGLGAGVATRWCVVTGDNRFFASTKRLHNLLHGFPGDGAALGADDLDHYRKVLARNLDGWTDGVRAGDVVVLHDPQTAGLVARLRERGAHVVWRCHVGADRTNEHTERAWSFLRPFIEPAQAWIFSRREYAPDWLPSAGVVAIPPSLDPFSPKNADIAPDTVRATLREAGLVDAPRGTGAAVFTRQDGSPGTVRRHPGLLVDEEGPLPADARLLLQVSRWDQLKDMAGVLTGFAEHRGRFPDDVHLLLAGPDVGGVSDDPEGAESLRKCRNLRAALPDDVRRRVHLCCLPMDDGDENAHLVNALQRYATVVVQKSLVEGFGLTVTEAMWKARPVLASAVGGIVDQIEDGTSGVLLDDPTDLDAFARAAAELVADPARCDALGSAARARVVERYLADRHLIQYAALFGSLLAAEGH